MTFDTKDSESRIRQSFINDFGDIISGNATPDEMADFVMEYVVNNNGMINLDYQDVADTLKGMKEGDCVVLETEKENIPSALNECRTRLNDSHPASKMQKLLLQIVAPRQSGLMMNDMQMFHDFLSSVGDDLEVTWGISKREDDSSKYILFMIAGFKD